MTTDRTRTRTGRRIHLLTDLPVGLRDAASVDGRAASSFSVPRQRARERARWPGPSFERNGLSFRSSIYTRNRGMSTEMRGTVTETPNQAVWQGQRGRPRAEAERAVPSGGRNGRCVRRRLGASGEESDRITGER